MAQVKRGAGESLIPLFSHPTLHFSKVAMAMRQQQYLLLVVFPGGAMEFGSLMSYGPDLDELFRHSAKYERIAALHESACGHKADVRPNALNLWVHALV